MMADRVRIFWRVWAWMLGVWGGAWALLTWLESRGPLLYVGLALEGVVVLGLLYLRARWRRNRPTHAGLRQVGPGRWEL